MSSLVDIITDRPHEVLAPSEELRAKSLVAIKDSFDPIAKQFSIFKEVHVDGLDVDQIWAQAQMVVDGALKKLMKRDYAESSEEGDDDDLIDGMSVDSEEDSQLELDSEEENVLEDENSEEFDGLKSADSEKEELEQDEEVSSDEDSDENKEKKSELDEGLFRLEDFQKQVLALERDDNDHGDGEVIDYFSGKLGAADEGSDSEDDNLRYEDFFSKPKKNRKAKPARRIRVHEAQTQEEESFEGFGNDFDEDQIEMAMATAKKDLFDEDDAEMLDEKDSGEGLSAFERQQRALMEEIQMLEEENVAEKEWAVRGEVKARDRPADSLMETELDFERNNKPVPVITQDVTDTLEDMIKNRIKNGNFDDLARVLPEDLPQFRKSRELPTVEETKSQKSLAELYEEDYAKKTNADYVSKESAALDTAHAEIEQLYQNLAYKLDSLSAWSYTPKPIQPSLTVISSSAPAISMEDAQPSGMSAESMLAPQEVYKPGTEKVEGERVTKAGAPVAKSEMTSEEKKKLRRKDKARRAKIAQEREEKQRSKATKEGSKANVIETLKKSGSKVTVIGNKGEKRDMSGKLIKEAQTAQAASIKL